MASDREQAREEVDQVSQDLENIDEQEEGDESGNIMLQLELPI